MPDKTVTTKCWPCGGTGLVCNDQDCPDCNGTGKVNNFKMTDAELIEAAKNVYSAGDGSMSQIPWWMFASLISLAERNAK